ncbi:helicase-exonuclease AddAB subunit AddB [Sporosarcina gallistercoris]|uniref:ATP-dependent helicase/deoxyribonuclease subunit B n=1 Tax=Sporosarcina gallistercoris TaxID=2762245 RepID=A0ABR8PNC2_9BACL|nr:helicase-exonuclease AddAB subunit AddB [Sporosarcina gallistercoris]MBD7909686.1 helicase-exonuclease AddAB subunit AddB [Sporosarcina gallistercoris]
MTLRFITGRSGTGKTYRVEQEIVESLQQDPLGAPIVLIVPDQMSYSLEHSLAARFGLNGMVRAQVLTFKRLAWRVLQETGGITRREVDGFGYRMLIRSVLEENREDFKLFRQAADKRGFTEQVEGVLKEFSRYCLDHTTLADLHTQLTAASAPRTLVDKAGDLSLLLAKVEERLGTTYVDSEGHLAMLSGQVQFSSYIKEADIYIDGFELLTNREHEIIRELLKFAKRVTVALPIDEEGQATEDHELFFSPMRTKQIISEIAREESVDIEPEVRLTIARRFRNPDVLHLEAQFDNYPATQQVSSGDVRVIEATDRRAEMHAVARSIRKLAMSGKRYNDMAILYRQPEVYDELIHTIFPLYDIPVFISQKKPMLHHPLIEFSRSVLEAVTGNWSYEAIFRAVKTDLFFPHGEDRQIWRERADRLENYVLAHGIHGHRWFDEVRWRVKKYRGLELHTEVQTDEELAMQAELHSVRDLIRGPLESFGGKLKAAKNGRQAAEALFTFMEELHVYDKIIDLRAEEERAGRLLGASEHEQAWTGWINVLDQFVLMFGDVKMAPKDAVRVLDEGFDTLEFARIPPSLDQVTVMTIDLATFLSIDEVFVIGTNDGVLPQRIDNEGLISDSDRQWFETVGFELAPSAKSRLMDESYKAYRAFTAASEGLTVSYPIADEAGKALIPSLYIPRLGQLFEGLNVEIAVADPLELLDDADEMPYISHPRSTLPYASAQLRHAETARGLSPLWQAVIAYYEADPLWASVLTSIQRKRKHGTETERLTADLTNGLYGETMSSSVSRVESYYSCPFQHFATYGLGLRERSEFTLEAPAIGDLFHAALKWVSDEIMRTGATWAGLTKEDCFRLAREAVDGIAPYFFHRILLSTSRHVYIKRKLTGIIQRTLFALRSQASASSFQPIAVEVGFGPGEQMPPLSIPLKRGGQMNLRGRIDRVDASNVNDKTYLRIVDYKSSSKALDLTEVYYGLSLQMLTYLDVALEHSDDWLHVHADPAGMLYVHVHNPMVRSIQELTEEAVEEEMLKSFSMKGYVLEDLSVVKEMDSDIEQSSKIIPARVKKDGSFYATSKVLAPDDMQLLRGAVRSRHRQAGDAMLAGDARVYPYRLKERMPCTHCPYQGVCQFDTTDPDAKYRNYAELSAKESLEKMRKEAESDAHTTETE